MWGLSEESRSTLSTLWDFRVRTLLSLPSASSELPSSSLLLSPPLSSPLLSSSSLLLSPTHSSSLFLLTPPLSSSLLLSLLPLSSSSSSLLLLSLPPSEDKLLHLDPHYCQPTVNMAADEFDIKVRNSVRSGRQGYIPATGSFGLYRLTTAVLHAS